MTREEKDKLINKAADWLRDRLSNTDIIPMCDWNKEFWVTAFIGYMNSDDTGR